MAEYVARLARQDEIPEIVEWTHLNRDLNGYDPDVFKYDSCRIMAVDRDGRVDGFLPFQATVMSESLAPRPARTKREIACILKAAIHKIARWALSSGMGEIYFLSNPEDEETRAFAKQHGYEELNLKVMRLKLHKMDPPLPQE